MDNRQPKSNQNITYQQILWYFIIFSVIGLIIETIFCYLTTGVIESRKGLIWGPFCPVYGVGATILIICLHTYQQKPMQLFFIGCILGNIIEYGLSYLLEAYYGTRFWDYSYYGFDINGRICLLYSIYWGVLSVALIRYVKPKVDTFIEKIPNQKKIYVTIILLLILDGLATIWAITSYQKRASTKLEQTRENTNRTSWQKAKTKIEETLFSNEIMVKTFPNLRYVDKDGNQYYIRDIIM